MPDYRRSAAGLLSILLVQPTPSTAAVLGSPQSLETHAEVRRAVAIARYRAKQRKSRGPRPRRRGRVSPGGYRLSAERLQELPEEECLFRFGVTANELFEMVIALDLPDVIHTRNRYRFSGVEALALTLARFRGSGDMYDLSGIFDRPQSAISEIVSAVVLHVDEEWSHLLEFDYTHLLSPVNLQKYASAIYDTGSPLDGVWGFIDCTIRRMTRPTYYQRQAYSGYKGYHALKFQAVILPNGLFGHLYGPLEGRRNDNQLVKDSEIIEMSQRHAVRDDTDEETPCELRYLQLFGDPAYGVSWQMVSPYDGAHRTPEELAWNNLMSQVRMAVEHGFGIVGRQWPFLHRWWKMRVGSSPVGSYYRAGVLLTNAVSCLYPNQISRKFCCAPPSIHEYFHR